MALRENRLLTLQAEPPRVLTTWTGQLVAKEVSLRAQALRPRKRLAADPIVTAAPIEEDRSGDLGPSLDGTADITAPAYANPYWMALVR